MEYSTRLSGGNFGDLVKLCISMEENEMRMVTREEPFPTVIFTFLCNLEFVEWGLVWMIYRCRPSDEVFRDMGLWFFCEEYMSWHKQKGCCFRWGIEPLIQRGLSCEHWCFMEEWASCRVVVVHDCALGVYYDCFEVFWGCFSWISWAQNPKLSLCVARR